MDGFTEPLRRPPGRLFHGIAERIAALIEEGAFPPGSKLPGERELAERFGVSRVTVREAAVALQAAGRVDIRAGSGVYVKDPARGARDGLPEVSPFELTEARSLFESEAAALAASIISDADLERLERCVNAMARCDPDLDHEEADRQFHLIIASVSGNRAILHTIQSLWRMRTELEPVKQFHASVCKTDASTLVAEHAAVLEALKRRDPAAARTAMRGHFNRLLEAMLDAAEARALEDARRQASQSRERFLLTARLG